jgi:hypothetical protein
MATREHESAGPPFGIAHVTVVPENFEPGRVDGRTEARGGEGRVAERPRGRASRESEE